MIDFEDQELDRLVEKLIEVEHQDRLWRVETVTIDAED